MVNSSTTTLKYNNIQITHYCITLVIFFILELKYFENGLFRFVLAIA